MIDELLEAVPENKDVSTAIDNLQLVVNDLGFDQWGLSPPRGRPARRPDLPDVDGPARDPLARGGQHGDRGGDRGDARPAATRRVPLLGRRGRGGVRPPLDVDASAADGLPAPVDGPSGRPRRTRSTPPASRRSRRRRGNGTSAWRRARSAAWLTSSAQDGLVDGMSVSAAASQWMCRISSRARSTMTRRRFWQLQKSNNLARHFVDVPEVDFERVAQHLGYAGLLRHDDWAVVASSLRAARCRTAPKPTA